MVTFGPKGCSNQSRLNKTNAYIKAIDRPVLTKAIKFFLFNLPKIPVAIVKNKAASP